MGFYFTEILLQHFVLTVFFNFCLTGNLVLFLHCLDPFLELLNQCFSLSLLLLLNLLSFFEDIIVFLLELLLEALGHFDLIDRTISLCLAGGNNGLKSFSFSQLLSSQFIVFIDFIQQLFRLLDSSINPVLFLNRELL